LKSLNFTKTHLSNELVGNFGSIINSKLESVITNFGLEYLTKDSTPKLVGVDFELLKVELPHVDFGLESTYQDSIPKSIGANFRVGGNHDRSCFHPKQ
jgi:hypothetical protein